VIKKNAKATGDIQYLLIIKPNESHKSKHNNNYGQSILGLKPNSRTIELGNGKSGTNKKGDTMS
jgi:hypothetical protein